MNVQESDSHASEQGTLIRTYLTTKSQPVLLTFGSDFAGDFCRDPRRVGDGLSEGGPAVSLQRRLPGG